MSSNQVHNVNVAAQDVLITPERLKQELPLTDDALNTVTHSMSNQANDQDDGGADSMAAVAIISLVVLTLYIWLSGMPT